MKYQVLIDGRHHSEHMGLIAACAAARTDAARSSGAKFEVEYDGRQMYRAQMRGGKLETWML